MSKRILTIIPQWFDVNGQPMKIGSPQEWIIPAGLDPQILERLYVPSIFINGEYNPYNYRLDLIIRIREDMEDALGSPNINAIE